MAEDALRPWRHKSWIFPRDPNFLERVEIYHSIIQRKLLDPNDFESTAELARALKTSSAATTRSPNRSTGPSPAATSQTS